MIHFLVPSAFSHCQMVLSFPKLCLLSFFSFWWRFSKKLLCSFVFSTKKAGQNPNDLVKQYKHGYVISEPIYPITITSHFASTILTVPKSVFLGLHWNCYLHLWFSGYSVIDVLFADITFLVWKPMANAVCGFLIKLWTMVTFTLVFCKFVFLKFFAIGADCIRLQIEKPKRSIHKNVENKIDF